jgi:hypothetical protein
MENFKLDNLYRKSWCHVVSDAFSISKNTAAVNMLLLKFKPNWLALSRPLSSIGLWTIVRITFSNSLPVVDKT